MGQQKSHSKALLLTKRTSCSCCTPLVPQRSQEEWRTPRQSIFILIDVTWSPTQRLLVFHGLTVGKTNRAFAGTAGQTADGRALSFPAVSPSRSAARARARMPTRCWRCSSVRVGARRSTATGSARWFPYPTIIWEPPLLTWVV